MGTTDPEASRHGQRSQILVPLDTPGVRIERLLTVSGYDDTPKACGEVVLEVVLKDPARARAGCSRGRPQ